MKFWNWFNKTQGELEKKKELFPYFKRIIVGLIFFILPIPVIAALIIRLERDWSLLLVTLLYWSLLHYLYKYQKSNERLKKLLSAIHDDEKSKRIFDISRQKIKMLNEERKGYIKNDPLFERDLDQILSWYEIK